MNCRSFKFVDINVIRSANFPKEFSAIFTKLMQVGFPALVLLSSNTYVLAKTLPAGSPTLQM